MKFIYLFVAILAEVIATSALKASEQFTKTVPSIIVIAGYVIAFYFLSLTLKSMPIGIAYALWSGVGIVLVSGAGYFLYKQTLDLPALIGIGLIIIGVIVINVCAKSAAH